MAKIRPIAICIFIHNNAILVFEGHDPLEDRTFYRPLGGGIELGEYSLDTAKREIREEIGAEITNVCYLATLENIFVYDGRIGHEIVMVYEADFVDPSFYEQQVLQGHEDDGTPFKAVWKSLTEFQNGHAPLYPNGLPELLQKR